MKYLGEQIMEEQGFCELSFSFFHIENCCLLVGTKVKSNVKKTVYWNERSNTFLQSVIANVDNYLPGISKFILYLFHWINSKNHMILTYKMFTTNWIHKNQSYF